MLRTITVLCTQTIGSPWSITISSNHSWIDSITPTFVLSWLLDVQVGSLYLFIADDVKVACTYGHLLCCPHNTWYRRFYDNQNVFFRKKTIQTIYISFLSLNIDAPSISGRFWPWIVPREIILDICYSKYIISAASLMLY